MARMGMRRPLATKTMVEPAATSGSVCTRLLGVGGWKGRTPIVPAPDRPEEPPTG